MRDEEKTYFIMQLELLADSEASFTSTLDILAGFYQQLKAVAVGCGFRVTMTSAEELQIAARPGAFFGKVTTSLPMSLQELAERLLSCIDQNLKDFTVLLPFEDGAKLALAELDTARWADISGFLDIQVEHGKKPKLKLLISRAIKFCNTDEHR